MSTTNLSSKSASAGLFAAIVASLCCITPVFSLLAGISGIAATFAWVEPFRPYLIALTIGILGFAWYQKLKPKTAEEIDCACDEDERPSFWQSKKFLSLVTVFAGLMLAFPSYSQAFYSAGGNQSGSFAAMQDTTKTNKIVIPVKGMTCAGCEGSIEHAVGLLKGVKTVDASYSNSSTTIEYYTSSIDKSAIVDAINKTGYKVVEQANETILTNMNSEGISFYKVPLVCNAAPTIGCGSRSKPILADLEKADAADEAWLNRGGTVMAVVWKDGVDYTSQRELINKVFTKHKVNASELLAGEFIENLGSFQDKTDWLRGADVDNLSKEEASIIADQILKPIEDKTSLSSTEKKKLGEMIKGTFYDFFLDYESVEQLGDPNAYKSRLEKIHSFGEELLGDGKMPSVDELWTACANASKSCNHEECSSSTSCKVPKKS